MRLERFSEADECLSRLSRAFPDDLFVDYTNGLSRACQGDSSPLFRAADLGLAATSETLAANLDPAEVSNRLLFTLVLGDSALASRAMDALIRHRAYEQLRDYTTPYLETLSGALADDTVLRTLQRAAIEFVWPAGWDADDAGTLRRATLGKIKREFYPFPIYCQKHSIRGLEEDMRLGERIQNSYAPAPKSIALWTIGRSDRVYDHSNFLKDEGAEWNFKFCDETQTILRTNLKILINGMGVKRLMFLQDDLRLQFEIAVKRNRLSIACVMADVPIEPDLR